MLHHSLPQQVDEFLGECLVSDERKLMCTGANGRSFLKEVFDPTHGRQLVAVKFKQYQKKRHAKEKTLASACHLAAVPLGQSLHIGLTYLSRSNGCCTVVQC